MAKVVFEVKLPAKIKKKADVYVSSCDVLDVHSQGFSEQEAKKNLVEAVTLFLMTCFEMRTIDQVLRDCGFRLSKAPFTPLRKGESITVPIPFSAKGSCLTECRA